MNQQRRFLIVDGNYFAQRVLGQLNTGSVCNLITEEEISQFKHSLYSSLINLWNTFSNTKNSLVHQMIFCTDFGSWRKDVEPFRPYWLSTEDDSVPLKYKEQRIAKKQESPIDYDAFYNIYREFALHLKQLGVVTFNIPKLEGDDNIFLFSKLIDEKFENWFGVVFATDGDLEQVVNDRVVLFKNIRSKDAPNGEVYMTLKTFGETFEGKKSIESMLTGNQLDVNALEKICQLRIGDIEGTTTVERGLNSGLKVAKPFRTIMVKSFAGDKKDNIFSPISWESKTGTVRYGITEKIIQKVFDLIGLSFTEHNCKEMVLSAKDSGHQFETFITYLIRELSPKTILTEEQKINVKRHIQHNLKMNWLLSEFIPTEHKENWLQAFKEQFEAISTGTFPTEVVENHLSTLSVNKSILSDSIPTDEIIVL